MIRILLDALWFAECQHHIFMHISWPVYEIWEEKQYHPPGVFMSQRLKWSKTEIKHFLLRSEFPSNRALSGITPKSIRKCYGSCKENIQDLGVLLPGTYTSGDLHLDATFGRPTHDRLLPLKCRICRMARPTRGVESSPIDFSLQAYTLLGAI